MATSVFDTPDIAAPSANITGAQLTSNLTKRTIAAGTSDVFRLVFEKAVDKDATHYTGTLTFSNGMSCVVLGGGQVIVVD